MLTCRGECRGESSGGHGAAAALLLALLPVGAGCGPRPAAETSAAAPAPLELTADEVEDQVRSIQQNPSIPEAQKAGMIAAARARGPKTGAPPAR